MSSTPETPDNPLHDLQLLETVGRGTFGIVKRGIYQGQEVAVKIFAGQNEQESFLKEIETLNRVNHKYIIQLYNWSPDGSTIVMEYAEGGNLYDLLHSHTNLDYGIEHALAWCYQSASALAYLHGQKPTPIVHRDFKPPNILLLNRCRTIKIADFGIACDVTSHMTTNRGTTYWMAPEVFMKNKYTEACDIFSFGITVWEITARRKPFSGSRYTSTFAVMWAISSNKRPPLLAGCPPILEKLITKCWSQEPGERPQMSRVETLLKKLTDRVVKTELPPVDVPKKTDRMPSALGEISQVINQQMESSEMVGSRQIYDFLPPMPNFPVIHQIPIDRDNSQSRETLREERDYLNLPQQPLHHQRGHRRSESVGFSDDTIESSSRMNFQRTRSMENRLDDDFDVSGAFGGVSLRRPTIIPTSSTDEGIGTTNWSTLTSCILNEIDPTLRPIQPDPTNEQSIRLFEEHSRLCHKFYKLKTELRLLEERKNQLDDVSDGLFDNIDDDISDQAKELDALFKLRNNLVQQVKKIREKKERQEAVNEGYVYVEK